MSTPDLAQQVADLTTATTELTQEVVGQKARLTTAADTANTKASEASGSAIAAEQSNVEAATEADQAKIEADRAKTEADRASEISGLDTVEEAVDMVLSEYAGVMSAAQRQAIIDANEEKYAASGMVHMGKYYSDGSNPSYRNINEGMWTDITSSNFLVMGVTKSQAVNSKSKSKTDFPVTHIAGAVSQLNMIGNQQSAILLPEAPDGTVIYDPTGNARGTGKANLNLLTEVDPKYGDSASTQNEAVARAFEGQIVYADCRNGVNDGWNGNATILDGVITVPAQNVFEQDNAFPVEQNKTYQIGMYVHSATTSVQIRLRNADGSGYVLTETINDEAGLQTWTYTHSGSDANLRVLIYPTVVASTISYSGLSVHPTTEEVVTDRVDMFGLEQFDMVMKDDEIFDMIQSQATTFGDTGVPTVTSVRPDSFFAVYDGQENIVKGKCVRWPDLNRAQKRHIAKYMKERLWVNEDGDLTFTSIRQRSFAGAGNGDWSNIDTTRDTELNYSQTPAGLVYNQGDADTVPTDSNAKYTSYPPHTLDLARAGVFSVRTKSYANAYKGRCFFYVLGTVSRLNQGAYHPSLNPYGTDGFISPKGATTVNWFAKKLNEPTTTAHCFIGREDYPATSGYKYNYGSIASAVHTQHPDGRLYDAIYADGLGGVVDYRLPAYESDSPEEAAKVWEKVKNGTYRGLEKLVFSTPFSLGTPEYKAHDGVKLYIGAASAGEYSNLNLPRATGTGLYTSSNYLVDASGSIFEISGVDSSGQYLYLATSYGSNTSQLDITSTCYVVSQTELNTSVSGDFTMTDVIGAPANILQTDALKDGWLGSWIPELENISKPRKLTKKSLDATAQRQYTSDNGTTWVNLSLPIDTTKNETLNIGSVATLVQIFSYTAFAKQTKPSTNKPVLNGEVGVGSVFVTSHNETRTGCAIAESLIGKVLKSNTPDPQYQNYKLTSLALGTYGSVLGSLLSWNNYTPHHAPLTLAAPSNNSQAVKALPYQISDNGQCSIGIQANELTWDVTADSWGDDSTMKITASGSDTFVDLNGNTNLSVVHELALPYGWTKNRARAGEQIEGVDL